MAGEVVLQAGQRRQHRRGVGVQLGELHDVVAPELRRRRRLAGRHPCGSGEPRAGGPAWGPLCGIKPKTDETYSLG